jgi:hypothetical protein
MQYSLAFGTANLPTPEARLARAIEIITGSFQQLKNPPFDLERLERVIISESSKAYLTKEVDEENKDGLFVQFKSLCSWLAALIKEYDPNFPHANSLASLLFSSHLDQRYFAKHLPSLSNIGHEHELQTVFYKKLMFSTIDQWQKR